MSKHENPDIGHVTQGSVFDDPALFDPSRAAELKMRAELLRGLERWLKDGGKTQTEAAGILGVAGAACIGRAQRVYRTASEISRWMPRFGRWR